MSGLAALIPAFLLIAALVAASVTIVVMLTVGLGLVPVVVALTALVDLVRRRRRSPEIHAFDATEQVGPADEPDQEGETPKERSGERS